MSLIKEIKSTINERQVLAQQNLDDQSLLACNRLDPNQHITQDDGLVFKLLARLGDDELFTLAANEISDNPGVLELTCWGEILQHAFHGKSIDIIGFAIVIINCFKDLQKYLDVQTLYQIVLTANETHQKKSVLEELFSFDVNQELLSVALRMRNTPVIRQLCEAGYNETNEFVLGIADVIEQKDLQVLVSLINSKSLADNPEISCQDVVEIFASSLALQEGRGPQDYKIAQYLLSLDAVQNALKFPSSNFEEGVSNRVKLQCESHKSSLEDLCALIARSGSQIPYKIIIPLIPSLTYYLDHSEGERSLKEELARVIGLAKKHQQSFANLAVKISRKVANLSSLDAEDVAPRRNSRCPCPF